MKVWVLWYTWGTVTGVLDCVPDDGLAAGLSRAGAELRRTYQIDDAGRFTRVRSPEPYFRNDERVYRDGGITLIARPFTLGESP